MCGYSPAEGAAGRWAAACAWRRTLGWKAERIRTTELKHHQAGGPTLPSAQGLPTLPACPLSSGCFPASPLRVHKIAATTITARRLSLQRLVLATGWKGESSIANSVLKFALGLLTPLRVPLAGYGGIRMPTNGGG